MAGWYWARRKAAYASAVASSTTRHTMTMLATVPAAKQISAAMPSRTPEPMATRMSRPPVPAVFTLPVRTLALLVVRAERGLGVGSGGAGGLRRDAAATEAAAVAGDATCGETSAGSWSGSSGGACAETGSGSGSRTAGGGSGSLPGSGGITRVSSDSKCQGWRSTS